MHPSTAARLDGSLTGAVLNAFADTWCVVTTWGVWCCSCRLCQCVSQRKLKISRRGSLSPVLDSREAPAKRVRPLNRSGTVRDANHTHRESQTPDIRHRGRPVPRSWSSSLNAVRTWLACLIPGTATFDQCTKSMYGSLPMSGEARSWLRSLTSTVELAGWVQLTRRRQQE